MTKPHVWHIVKAWPTAVPDDVGFIIRPGAVPQQYAGLVRREALRCRRPVRFIGDLDPQDLAVFLSLAFGDYRFRPKRETAVPIVYAGISDDWLEAAERALLPSAGNARSIDFAKIELNPIERRFLSLLERVGPPLEEWVGPRCAGLLRGGHKIELEALLAKADLFDGSYAAGLRHVLVGRGERYRRTSGRARVE
jgi:hypothetical protein